MNRYTVLKKLLRTAWSISKIRLALALVSIILLAISEASLPRLISVGVERLYHASSESETGILFIFVLIGFAGLRALVQYTSFLMLSQATYKTFRMLRDRMSVRFIEHFHIDDANFSSDETAKLISSDTEKAARILPSVAATLLLDTFTITFLLAYLMHLSWQATLTVLSLLTAVLFIVRILNVHIRRAEDLVSSIGTLLGHRLREISHCRKVILLHNGHEIERRKVDAVSAELYATSNRYFVLQGLIQPVTEFLSTAALVTILCWALAPTSLSSLSKQDLLTYIFATFVLIWPLKHVTEMSIPLHQLFTTLRGIFKLLDQSVATLPPGGLTLPTRVREIEFRDVTFCRSNAQSSKSDVLKNISFSVVVGETLALVGPSGSGKTTIVDLLSRFTTPFDGDILLDGVSIEAFNLQSLRDGIAMVTQDVMLFDDTIANNVSYGAPVNVKKVEHALRVAFLWETIQKLSDGINSTIGANGTLLSGGERQRLAIARAIYKDAPILILDEATSALDAESEYHFKAACKSLTADRATIVIAHKLSTVESVDKILFVEQGRITEMGRHVDLLALNGSYARFHEMQSSIATPVDAGKAP